MIRLSVGTRPGGRSCPMPGTISSFEPGIACAVCLPAASGTSGSSAPCITSVGTLIVLSRLTREPSLRIASICRPISLRVIRAIDGSFYARTQDILWDRVPGASDDPIHVHHVLDDILTIRCVWACCDKGFACLGGSLWQPPVP